MVFCNEEASAIAGRALQRGEYKFSKMVKGYRIRVRGNKQRVCHYLILPLARAA